MKREQRERRSVVTLTMNPAVDRSIDTKHVVPDHKLRCRAPRIDPGGGGLNVARAIRELGGEALALYPAGGAAGELLHDLLAETGIDHEPIPIAGRTRENFTVRETATNAQYRFVLPGPELRRDEWERCLSRLSTLQPLPRYLVMSGSLPPGAPEDFYARAAVIARQVGARAVLDTSGAALRRGLEGGVYLLKPNLRELGQLVATELRGEAEQERAALELVDAGWAEVVVVSLGAAGVLLVSAEVVERIRSPSVPIRSRIGAGDCTVAGIVAGLSQGDDLRHAVRRGVAAGAAAAMTPGTELCRRADAERLYAALVAELAEVKARNGSAPLTSGALQ
jgi:6-phosphofructokinase 2